MENNEKLSNEEINKLIEKSRSGDNTSWETLFNHYKEYVHSRAWNKIQGLYIKNPKIIEDELFSAGWVGFVDALKNYDDEKGKFTTYVTYYIDHEINKQIKFEFNSMGLVGKPKELKVSRVYAPIGEDADDNAAKMAAFEAIMSRAVARNASSGISIPKPEDLGDYTAERRALQILDVLKLMTDEDHSLSYEELKDFLSLYRKSKYSNDTPIESPNTFNKSMAEILLELNPDSHTDDNDRKYKVKYDYYDSDYLKSKVRLKKDNANKIEVSPVINGLRYVHDFDNETLDKLIQLVSFSDMFSNEDKSELIDKLLATASVYYKTPFADGDNLRFNPAAIHGRFSKRNGADRAQLTENIKKIQYAINNLAQIRFKFNQYTSDHKLMPKHERMNILSPYHMVVYHDNYYVIGLNQAWGDKRVLHYRVDLMSDIEISRDDEGKIIPIEVCDFEGLPICNSYWDPEKYMSEHINMAYDDPREIRIKIKEDSYTLIHDWFGDHYKKVDSVIETDDEENIVNYDIVVVRTSPFMMVHWAMQYGTTVEIMDEEIREKIKEELKEVNTKYGNQF